MNADSVARSDSPLSVYMSCAFSAPLLSGAQIDKPSSRWRLRPDCRRTALPARPFSARTWSAIAAVVSVSALRSLGSKLRLAISVFNPACRSLLETRASRGTAARAADHQLHPDANEVRAGPQCMLGTQIAPRIGASRQGYRCFVVG